MKYKKAVTRKSRISERVKRVVVRCKTTASKAFEYTL